MMHNRGIAGTTTLVTGAAGGIGTAVVQTLAGLGATVAAVDHDAERLHETAKSMADDGLATLPYPADVTDSANVNDTVARVERELGPIQHLVNAAGVLLPRKVCDLTDEEWAAMFAVNTTGVFFTSRAVLARMTQRSSGSMVTVASNAAGTARTEMAAYAASKAAATAFTKCLGLEAAHHGIRCNVVAPGSTDTPMLSSLWGDSREAGERVSIEGAPEAYRVGIPLRKLATPSDVAEAVAFLLSDQASHITMQDLIVDGGATLGA
ncbi:2,3-dihydro-2,3-dihydroxybenzoate dehydrogenase [Salinactinospora qingdaonensis]|uniref:2,3-dihydro-2,3-dihydroxybenzoate dehydrogenase n=1 Tax=Salinactinospora qingdaonensis TaxID=702744 RepID=A0ABP7EWB8_9ACTN